jgi:hypothetical protein
VKTITTHVPLNLPVCRCGLCGREEIASPLKLESVESHYQGLQVTLAGAPVNWGTLAYGEKGREKTEFCPTCVAFVLLFAKDRVKAEQFVIAVGGSVSNRSGT